MTTENSKYGFDVRVRFYHHSNFNQDPTEEFYCALLNSNPIYKFSRGAYALLFEERIHVIIGETLKYEDMSHISYFIQFIPVGKKPRGYGTSLKRIVEGAIVEFIQKTLESKRSQL